MKENIKIILDDYSEKFKDYGRYIKSNDWSKSGDYDGWDLENTIVTDMISNISQFKTEIGSDAYPVKVQDFFKKSMKTISTHISRTSKYLDEYKWSTMFESDVIHLQSQIEALEGQGAITKDDIKYLATLRTDLNIIKSQIKKEMVNQSDIFTKNNKIKLNVAKLEIDTDNTLGSTKSANLFFSDKKATLYLREFLCKHLPIVKSKVESLGIDFNAISINPSTSNEMLINMKPEDIPPYDSTKHFFEQPISTIQFWEEERRKNINGITVGGYFIHPWLYFHLNSFKIPDAEDSNSEPKHPDFRDNEYFFTEMLKTAEDDGKKAILMYGSRRISKSVVMSSYMMYKLVTILNASCKVIGFVKDPDLDAIVNYINVANTNMHPALNINANNLDFEKGITLGLKANQQDRLDYSKLSFVNLEGGTKKASTQKTAGSTPNGFLFDEIGKGACIKPWMSALPSFAKKDGSWRTIPLLGGTSGESSVSKDAERILKNPEQFNIMPMNWEILEKGVDPEWVTWNKGEKFAMFVPAQMSLEAGSKISKTFADFLNLPEKSPLNAINIQVTDWENTSRYFKERRELLKTDLDLQSAEANSFPITQDDCYLTPEKNKFPGLKARNRRKLIEQNGEDGVKVRLVKNPSTDLIDVNISDEPIILDYPYGGGNFDAPPVILEILEEGIIPPLGLYCMGFDDVKHDKSDGDSVISATIMKRSYEGGEWANRIVAWYDSRPEKKDYYRNLFLLMKYYNCRVLAENEDNGYLEYLEDLDMRQGTNHVSTHMSEGVGLASEDNLNRNNNRKFGWAPTSNNIYHLENKIVMYTKQDGVVIGNVEDLEGIDLINHPMLLEELFKYKKDNNADRIRSFGLALTLVQYYDKTYQYMKRAKYEKTEESKKTKKKSFITANGLTDNRRLRQF